MKRSGKLVLSLVVGSILVLISSIAFALGFFQEGDLVNQENVLHTLRIQAIQQLIGQKFNHFVSMPFGPGSDNMHLSGSMTYPDYPDYILTTGIQLQDDLDILLAKKIEEMTGSLATIISLTAEEVTQLQKVYLFKSEQDLKDLGYVVSSYRTRVNTDEDWRKDNIAISYRNIGNIRVLNAQQKISFMDEIHYDASAHDWKRDTVDGLAIMGGVSTVKGGGICGAAWGINAVILTNKAFDIRQRDNHSRTYKNMYQNEINGKEYRIPGIDVAVFRMGNIEKDFVFENVRDYPVILVMNYDGTRGGTEELFVLSKAEDRGELKYIGNKGKCYTWEANGKQFTSCYTSVAR